MLEQARNDIERWLRRAGRARRSRLLSLRIAAAVTGLSAGLVLALLVLPWAPESRGWIVLALACLLAVGLLHVAAPLFRRSSPLAVAAWLSRREPARGGALADAFEFATALARDGRVSTGSTELASAHVRSVAETLSQRDPEEPVRAAWPVTGWRRAVVALACSLAVLTALPRSRSLLFLGIAPGARDVARYDGVELRYAYPEYLRLPARTELGSGDVQAPRGTHVALRVQADRPLAWARLELEGGAAQDMSIQGNTAVGGLVVQEDGAYRIVLQGEVGESDPDPPLHSLRAIPDLPPTVRLSSPTRDEILPRGGDLDIVWRVADDHGVAELVLVVEPQTEGEPEPPRTHPLATFDPPVLSRLGSRRFGLRELGLAPGSSALIHLRARDDDLASGPKWAESRRVLITSRSHEEIRRNVDAGQEQLAESLLALLGHHLVSAPERFGERAELEAAAELFGEGLRQSLTLFDPVLNELDSGPEADLAALRALEEMRDRLRELSRLRRRLVTTSLADTGSELRWREQLERLHPGEVRELETDVLFFDMWEDRRAALRASDAADELMAALSRLSSALGEPDAEREPELDELDAALDEATRQAEQAAAMARELERAVPEEVAADAGATERAGELAQLLADVRQALEHGQVEDARWLASEVRSRGEDLARAIEDLASHGSVGDPELMTQMRGLQAELSNIRARQADLRDRTNAIRDEAQDAMSGEDRERMDELFQELIELASEAVALHEDGERLIGEARAVRAFFDALDEVARMRDELRGLLEAANAENRLPSRGEAERQRRLRVRMNELELQTLLGPGDVEPLMRHSEQAREQLGRLLQTLQDRDAEAAERPARHGLYRLDELSRGLERSQDADLRERVRPFRSAQAKVADILTRLEEIDRQARAAGQRALTDQQRRELGEIADMQGELARRAADLAERLREAGIEAPFLGREVGEAVGRAADGMRDARSRLGEGEAARASETQGDALSRLEEAAERLSPRGPRSGRGSGASGRDGRRGYSSRENVEIPDADAYRVPKEFREEILQAMRESAAPKGYEEQVREYYRRLVE